MQKVHKKLTKEQKGRGVVFTSTLSTGRTEKPEDCTHEVMADSESRFRTMRRLEDDSFFNDSPWSYNIIRT